MECSEYVLSDVHADKVVCDESAEEHVTRFVFRVPVSETKPDHQIPDSTENFTFDEDGDFDFYNDQAISSYDVICLRHHMSTELSAVGLQVWRGALVMCDYILHNKERFFEKHVLELGCGTGLTGIAAGQFAASVTCTDVGQEVLDLCQKNFNENSRIFDSSCVRTIKALDWHEDFNVKELYVFPDFVLVADCVYDDNRTEALFRTLHKFVTNSTETKPIILISLEKRLNFTLSDLDVTCHEYDHFRRCLEELQKSTDCSIENLHLNSLPLYFDYDRTKYVELWEIHS